MAAGGTTAKSGFIGRERELAELHAGLADVTAAHGHLFLLSGEPGIGKTRLADEFGRQAVAQGVRVAWGRCWEGSGARILAVDPGPSCLSWRRRRRTARDHSELGGDAAGRSGYCSAPS
jgi:hypothetical protein